MAACTSSDVDQAILFSFFRLMTAIKDQLHSCGLYNNHTDRLTEHAALARSASCYRLVQDSNPLDVKWATRTIQLIKNSVELQTGLAPLGAAFTNAHSSKHIIGYSYDPVPGSTGAATAAAPSAAAGSVVYYSATDGKHVTLSKTQVAARRKAAAKNARSSSDRSCRELAEHGTCDAHEKGVCKFTHKKTRSKRQRSKKTSSRPSSHVAAPEQDDSVASEESSGTSGDDIFANRKNAREGQSSSWRTVKGGKAPDLLPYMLKQSATGWHWCGQHGWVRSHSPVQCSWFKRKEIFDLYEPAEKAYYEKLGKQLYGSKIFMPAKPRVNGKIPPIPTSEVMVPWRDTLS
jgi:hypothetical protein